MMWRSYLTLFFSQLFQCCFSNFNYYWFEMKTMGYFYLEHGFWGQRGLSLPVKRQLCLLPAVVRILGDSSCAALVPKGHLLRSLSWASLWLHSMDGINGFWRALFYSVDLFIYTCVRTILFLAWFHFLQLDRMF